MEAAVWTLIAILAGGQVATFAYLGGKIDALGARLDTRIDGLSARMDALSARVDDGFNSLSARIDGLSERLDSHLDRRHPL